LLKKNYGIGKALRIWYLNLESIFTFDIPSSDVFNYI